ncbi:MAG TPA: hypothetical protein VHJ83_07450 [Micromonosporaceae bacterium]|jgi:hypothetical protein|nr:hypothetical protein [Micromonosporaceae bacterium]
MKPHNTDHLSLAFGVLFLAVAGWWLIAQITDLTVSAHVMAWLVAGLLMVVGAVGIITAIRSGPDSSD